MFSYFWNLKLLIIKLIYDNKKPARIVWVIMPLLMEYKMFATEDNQPFCPQLNTVLLTTQTLIPIIKSCILNDILQIK